MRYFIIVVLWATGFSAPFSSPAQCKDLDFEDGVARNLLNPDLFNIVINSTFLGCPKFNQGDSTLCGKIVNSKDDWDIGLPDGLLFTILFHPSHYKYVEKILNDKFLVTSLANVPEPSAEALNWFNERKHFNTVLVMSGDNETEEAIYDRVQRKLISVYYSVKSWTYCPEKNSLGVLPVHGIFDTNNNIIIYNTACKASNVYRSKISDTALAFRLFFVCSHEFAHALDKLSGQLPATPTRTTRNLGEKRANVNGLILTRAFARLFQEMLVEYKTAIKNSDKCLPCDKAFLKQTIKTWEKVDDYFTAKISEAKSNMDNEVAVLQARVNDDWSAWACMEPEVLNQK